MATHTARPYAPPPPPVEPEHHGAAGPVLGGIGMILFGGLLGFASIVGWAFADHSLSGWDRLADGDTFGLPSALTAIIAVVLLAVGFVMIGVGIGNARRNHDAH